MEEREEEGGEEREEKGEGGKEGKKIGKPTNLTGELGRNFPFGKDTGRQWTHGARLGGEIRLHL